MMLIDPHFQGAFSVVERAPIAKAFSAIFSCQPQASKDGLGAILRKKPTCQRYESLSRASDFVGFSKCGCGIEAGCSSQSQNHVMSPMTYTRHF